MPRKPEGADDERLARLARDWFADVRHREAEEAATERARRRSDGGDGGSMGADGEFECGADGDGDGGGD